MKIKFFDEAIKELNNIYSLIVFNGNEKAAVTVFNDILDEIDKLKIFPNIGKVHTSILRVWIVLRRYYVVYFYENDIIYIVLIWDCRRNPEDFKNRILSSLE